MKARTRQYGVGLIAVIFLTAILAVVGAAFALIATSQQVSSARAMSQTRAYYAARAGLDEVLQAARDGACGGVPGSATVDGIDVALGCTEVPVRERNETYTVFTLTALAVTGSKSAGTLVRRRLEVQAAWPDD